MGTLINLYAGATGLWKKIAAWLPLLAGAGSVLAGAGAIAVQIAHAPDAAGMVKVISGLGPTDPNVAMIAAGLTALGIHTNHAANAAQIDDHDNKINQVLPPTA